MKTLALRTYSHVTDAQILSGVMRAPQHAERGMDIDEMRRSIRVLDVLEALADGAGEARFEDADFACLFEKFRTARFVAASREILDLLNRIEAAAAH